jgi:hypothetical protein
MIISFLKRSIFIAVILAIVFGFAFTLAQQGMRQSANDPQIQIAEDTAAVLSTGDEPKFLTDNASNIVDMDKSLAPFLMTFDNNGKLLVSTAKLNGTTPVPPAGVFTYAKAHGEDRITWQPAKGVRIAAVVAHYGGQREGYALAGRSLREVENRTAALQNLAFWAWLATTIFAIISSLFLGSGKKFNKSLEAKASSRRSSLNLKK